MQSIHIGSKRFEILKQKEFVDDQGSQDVLKKMEKNA